MLHLLLSAENLKKVTSHMEPDQRPTYRARFGACRIGIANNLVHSDQFVEEVDGKQRNDDENVGGISVDVNNTQTSENNNKCGPFSGCVRCLKTRGYWRPIMKTTTFIVHFLVVMLILFGGAVVFAYMEDGELIKAHDGDPHMTHNATEIPDNSSTRLTRLWSDIHLKFNVTVAHDVRHNLSEHLKEFV